MRTLRRLAAVWICKILIRAAKLFGKRGSATPGKAALAVAPDILRHLAARVRRGIIVVCGTNGKTTTNNFIYTLLTAEGYKVVCNRVGANMLYGAVTAFAGAAKISGGLDADFACIEVDELSAVKVFAHFTPDCIVMTNLFRDQLDRYGEIDITFESLKRAAAMAGKAALVVNADDPLLAAFALQCLDAGADSAPRACVYFGIDSVQDEGGSEHNFIGENSTLPAAGLPASDPLSPAASAFDPPSSAAPSPAATVSGLPSPDSSSSCGTAREGRFCRLCGEELQYDVYYYSQMGHYSCPGCGFARPAPDYAAGNVRLRRGISFDVGGERIGAESCRGLYNVYNMLAACAVLKQYNIRTDGMNEALAAYRPQAGRMESFRIHNKDVVLTLSKNPAGFDQAILALLTDARTKAVVIVINDNAQDGRDISWLWDVTFERLTRIPDIFVSGLRAHDMRVRMKYAGSCMEGVRLYPKIKDALSAALACDAEAVYMLVNYTAVFGAHDLLRKMERKSKSKR